MLRFKKALSLRIALRTVQIRSSSTLPVHLEEKINKDLENEIYKPKDHPGRVRLRSIQIPDKIRDAIKTAVNDDQVHQLIADGEQLDRHLSSRKPPQEQKDIFLAKKEIQREILQSKGITHMSQLDDGENLRAKHVLKREVLKVYYQKNYNWQPIVYDEHKPWTYLFGRAAKEYAAILYIFSEIARRDPKFEPRSFFDFGAGVGTGTWAAAELWKNSLYEYFLVDESVHMNNLSELILRDGNEDKQIRLKNVFYRQFLPASEEFKSHLILSAFTLIELPDMKTRLDTLLTLWKKCDGYMVLIENGTKDGFKLIEEARAFLLQQAQREGTAYLFAPCPHELPCPRALKDNGKSCNFPINYRSIDIGQTKQDKKFLCSYLVFKKGSRNDDKTIDWPRVVRPTQIRTRHTRCKLCTHRGKLEEIVVTKGKHSKYTYRCARKSDWGDRMPIEFEENECNSSDSELSDSDKS